MRIERVTVEDGCVCVRIRMAEGEPLRTTGAPEVAERLAAALAGLWRHGCGNTAGRPFIAEALDTEVPHLFEHVVLEVMALAGAPRTLRGSTSWDFSRDGQGVFEVTIEHDDDVTCLGAVRLAEQVITYVVSGGARPPIGREIQRLAALRSAAAAGEGTAVENDVEAV